MKASVLVLLSLLLCSQFIVLVHASGGSKVTTFHIGGDMGSALCDLDVHFSWDSDTWKTGEKHTVSFSLEAKNINDNVVNLTIHVEKILIQLDSDKYRIYPTEVVSEDVSNQVTEMVWRMQSTTMMNTVRSFSFDFDVPKPLSQLTEDANVKLIYVVQLGGNFYYFSRSEGVSSEGSGSVGDYVSNDATRVGGIEDPVWITLKAEPQFPWLYVVVAVALVGVGIAGTSAYLFVRNRKLKIRQIPPPP